MTGACAGAPGPRTPLVLQGKPEPPSDQGAVRDFNQWTHSAGGNSGDLAAPPGPGGGRPSKGRRASGSAQSKLPSVLQRSTKLGGRRTPEHSPNISDSSCSAGSSASTSFSHSWRRPNTSGRHRFPEKSKARGRTKASHLSVSVWRRAN